MLIPVEALFEWKADFAHYSTTSMGAVDDFAPEPVLPLPYEEAISQGIGPQVFLASQDALEVMLFTHSLTY